MTDQWTDIAACEEIIDGFAKEFVVEGRIIAVFKSNKKLYALDGMCAHQGGPIAEGVVEHDCVTCPWHGWQYELATGIQTINRQPLQETFEIRENEGRIEIRI
ncbi:MAG: Rieske 2Fe-2S domain-containing protein [Pirellulaceae bacterium]